MDVEYLLGSLLRGVMSSRGKRKKAKGAMRFVLGNRRAAGSGAMLLGGLAFALFEHLQKGSGVGTGTGRTMPPAETVPPGAPVSPRPTATTAAPPAVSGATLVPPPIPGAAVDPPPPPGATATPAAPPPLPAESPVVAGQVPPEVLRVIRLSLSAAHADGVLTPAEQEAILAQARPVGAEALIADDLRSPRDVAEILDGVADPLQRQQLYTIAFAIVRADESVTPQEREYLQRVADALHLDAELVRELEKDAAGKLAEDYEPRTTN